MIYWNSVDERIKLTSELMITKSESWTTLSRSERLTTLLQTGDWHTKYKKWLWSLSRSLEERCKWPPAVEFASRSDVANIKKNTSQVMLVSQKPARRSNVKIKRALRVLATRRYRYLWKAVSLPFGRCLNDLIEVFAMFYVFVVFHNVFNIFWTHNNVAIFLLSAFPVFKKPFQKDQSDF